MFVARRLTDAPFQVEHIRLEVRNACLKRGSTTLFLLAQSVRREVVGCKESSDVPFDKYAVTSLVFIHINTDDGGCAPWQWSFILFSRIQSGYRLPTPTLVHSKSAYQVQPTLPRSSAYNRSLPLKLQWNPPVRVSGIDQCDAPVLPSNYQPQLPQF